MLFSWRYLRNRLGAAQEILLGSRPVGLDLVKFLKKRKEIGLFEQALTRTISFRFFFFARHTRRFLLKALMKGMYDDDIRKYLIQRGKVRDAGAFGHLKKALHVVQFTDTGISDINNALFL